MLRNILFNDRELRAGWRFALYVVLVVVLGLGAFAALKLTGHIRPHSSQGPAEMFVSSVIIVDSIFLLLFVTPALILGRFEHRSLGDYGLPGRGAFGRRFWEGVLWGVGVNAVKVLVLIALGVCQISGFALSPVAGLKYGLLWAIAFVLVGLAEEFGFRGYTQFTLTTGMGFWGAALLMSGGFALAHVPNPGETWLGIVTVFVAGIGLALALRRTGTLWFLIGWHTAGNWMQTFFFGVANSGGSHPHGYLLNTSFSGSHWLTGGTVGFEGSVVNLALMVLAIVLLHFRFPHVQYPRAAAIHVPVRASEAAPVVSAANS